MEIQINLAGVSASTELSISFTDDNGDTFSLSQSSQTESFFSSVPGSSVSITNKYDFTHAEFSPILFRKKLTINC